MLLGFLLCERSQETVTSLWQLNVREQLGQVDFQDRSEHRHNAQPVNQTWTTKSGHDFNRARFYLLPRTLTTP